MCLIELFSKTFFYSIKENNINLKLIIINNFEKLIFSN